MYTRETFILNSIRRALENAIADCGYVAVYLGVACEVFPDARSPDGGTVVPPEASGAPLTPDQERRITTLRLDVLGAIDQFGYDVVYFGVGCPVFDRAIDPEEKRG